MFNLDEVRVPQKYPGKKHFKGPNAGQYSCNPLGKNPGDLWVIPNVKSNHIEKTEHPCQFPVELIERFVLAMSNEGDWVFDPFLGTGTSIIAMLTNQWAGFRRRIFASPHPIPAPAPAPMDKATTVNAMTVTSTTTATTAAAATTWGC